MIRYFLAGALVLPIQAHAYTYQTQSPFYSPKYTNGDAFYLPKQSESAPPPVSAKNSEQQRMHECAMKGLTFQMAAVWRDSGRSPQYAFDYIQKAHYGMDDAFIKRAVNLVYFDDRFAGIPPAALEGSITQACIFPPRQWNPVQ
jgi:hypothetical protein